MNPIFICLFLSLLPKIAMASCFKDCVSTEELLLELKTDFGEKVERSMEAVLKVFSSSGNIKPSDLNFGQISVERWAMSPLADVSFLKERFGAASVSIKNEGLFPLTRSFKGRGAAAAMLLGLTKDELESGEFFTASAGNHAQGCARVASWLDEHEYPGFLNRMSIYMPESTPKLKIESTRNLGTYDDRHIRIVKVGTSFMVAKVSMESKARQVGGKIIHPYDDPWVITGQATVALEFIHQHQRQYGSYPDYVIVPVGGGGLIAGIALYMRFLGIDSKIIGVKIENFQGTLAEGIAVERQGVLNREILHNPQYVNGIMTYDLTKNDGENERRLRAWIGEFYEEGLRQNKEWTLEGASAISLMAMQDLVEEDPSIFVGKRIVFIGSGSNISPDKLDLSRRLFNEKSQKQDEL